MLHVEDILINNNAISTYYKMKQSQDFLETMNNIKKENIVRFNIPTNLSIDKKFQLDSICKIITFIARRIVIIFSIYQKTSRQVSYKIYYI